jgi:hypothetical protein
VLEVNKVDFEKAGQLFFIIAAQQTAEDRIRVQLRHARPNHGSVRID